MIPLHIHVQLQYEYKLFHIYFTIYILLSQVSHEVFLFFLFHFFGGESKSFFLSEILAIYQEDLFSP